MEFKRESRLQNFIVPFLVQSTLYNLLFKMAKYILKGFFFKPQYHPPWRSKNSTNSWPWIYFGTEVVHSSMQNRALVQVRAKLWTPTHLTESAKAYTSHTIGFIIGNSCAQRLCLQGCGRLTIALQCFTGHEVLGCKPFTIIKVFVKEIAPF